jgi:hypothetical protein
MLKESLPRADPGFSMRHELAGDEGQPGQTIDSIVLARQPILDRRELVVGYALHSRPLTPAGGARRSGELNRERVGRRYG